MIAVEDGTPVPENDVTRPTSMLNDDSSQKSRCEVLTLVLRHCT